MRYLLLCFSVSFLPTLSLTAQKYDNIWMNGNYDNFYIDFANFPPSIYPINNQYFFARTLTFMNDTNSLPAFYSNGCTIQNANHELLENGDSLLPNDYFCASNDPTMNFSHGSGVTLPTFSPQQYVIFSVTVDLPLTPSPCERSRLVAHYIDMSANQGQGKVTEKAQELLSGCLQEPTANRHANGRDWWILMGDNHQNRFFRWLLTPQGLQGPWEQLIENPTVDGYGYCGWSEFSPDGQRYLINSCRTQMVLYDFDRCTGLLSNPLFIERTSTSVSGATFSPDNRLLYTMDMNNQKLLQYDLEASDVNGSRTLLATWDGHIDSMNVPSVFGFIQNGPDGKLYIWGGSSYYMHVVDFPDRQGFACHFQQRAIKLPGYSFAAGLYYPHYRLGPIDGSSCDTLGIDNHPSALFRYDLEDTLSPLQVTFTDVSSYLPTAWHWDFGDGQMSQDTNPVHLYNQPGIYNVCLIASNEYAADTFCRQITVGTVSIHELPALPQAKVLPNPFSKDIMVQLPALVGVQPHFVLSDLYGRTVANVTLRNFDTTISLPGIPAGVYVWQLFWNGVQMQQGKLVKVE